MSGHLENLYRDSGVFRAFVDGLEEGKKLKE